MIAKLENITFKRNNRFIFDNSTFHIRRGKVTVVMGPSGCGKTTLLRLIGGELKPLVGNVEFNGQMINQLSRKQLYKARSDMGMLFQSGALFTNLTVFENVAFPLREHTRLPEAMIRDLVLMKLQAVGLRGARDLNTSELSGGMARRVALARAIVMDPQLIMYDEPFTGQDPISMGVLVKLIRHLNDALNMTTVLVSHDVDEAMSIADYVYVISNGKIVGEGVPDEIRQTQSPNVRQFIDGLPDGVVPFHYPAKPYSEDLFDGGSTQ